MVNFVNTDKWAPLIGRLFIAFGSIERITHQCIRQWAGSTIHNHVAKNSLLNRLELAVDLTHQQDAAESLKTAFIGSLQTAKALSAQRNRVAHNPLCLIMSLDPADEPFREAIAHNTKESDFLTFEDLTLVVLNSERCSEELMRNFAAFRIANLNLKSFSSDTKLRTFGSD